MGHTRLTILVEDLANLVGAMPANQSYPSIELLLARGQFHPGPDLSADQKRMSLFGVTASEVPVAALTRLADGGHMPAGRYWLRADAVTQRADMTRVFMTGAGLDWLPEPEQQDISRCIGQVFKDEGLDYCAGPGGRWTFSLEAAPGFSFMPLDDALGLDMADALPDGLEARNWRRIINEAQVALHNHQVNIAQRQNGQVEVNGIWLWGGGYLPEPAAETLFEKVFSAHPVSCGLAVLNGSELHDLQSFNPAVFMPGGRALLDWTVQTRDAPVELGRLESLLDGLLKSLRSGSLSLVLAGPGGLNWAIDKAAMRRFWRRPAPLPELIKRFSR